jgi:hypothetical protein
MNPPRTEDTLMRNPDVTIEARLKVDPDFAIALYHEQRKRIAELETSLEDIAGYATIETPQEVIDIINKTIGGAK